ncbi:MAG: M56 family metallopeptidase [Chlamydiales bacterium]|nr:M56 family metallopeptidase [Chlamydiales bacterium]
MNGNPFWLISFLISTSLAFFFGAFLVEIAITLFRIKKHRARSILRLFPMFSLAVDFFLSKLSTGNLLNPLHCESCIQKLFLHFAPELKNYLTHHQIAWSRHLASQMPDSLLTTFFVVFSTFSAVLFTRKIFQILSFHRILHALIKQGDVCQRRIENKSLYSALQKQKVKIFVSDKIHSPMAAYLRTIIIPKNLTKQLSQDEFEAVVSHELEHLRWKDPILKLFCEIQSTLYWWVPTKWWLKRVDQDQEMSADASIRRYHLDHTALASVLVKIAGSRAHNKPAAFCTFAAKANSLLVRLQMTLDPLATPLQKNLLSRAFFALAAGSLILLSCLM